MNTVNPLIILPLCLHIHFICLSWDASSYFQGVSMGIQRQVFVSYSKMPGVMPSGVHLHQTGKWQLSRMPDRAGGKRSHHKITTGPFLSFQVPHCKKIRNKLLKDPPFHSLFSGLLLKVPAEWSHPGDKRQPAAFTILAAPHLSCFPQKLASCPSLQVRLRNKNMKQLNLLWLCKSSIHKCKCCHSICNNIQCITRGSHYGSTENWAVSAPSSYDAQEQNHQELFGPTPIFLFHFALQLNIAENHFILIQAFQNIVITSRVAGICQALNCIAMQPARRESHRRVIFDGRILHSITEKKTHGAFQVN